MSAPLTALAISFIVTFSFLPSVIKIATLKKLFDEPDERKIHTRKISSLGGIAIFAGFAFAILFTTSLAEVEALRYYLLAGLIVFSIGVKDDLLVIKPFSKLCGQIVAAAILIQLAGLKINNLQGFLGINELPAHLSTLFTYFIIVLIVNACNLIDGVDGLAGMLGLSISLLFGCYFIYCDQFLEATLAFTLCGALVAFLRFNMQPAAIFMGDSGSMLVGLVLSILLIRFLNFAPNSTVLPVLASPVIAFCFLTVPLFDTIRVFAIRIFRGKSPFKPDKNHLHHMLLKLGWSHLKISLSLSTVNFIFVVLGFSLSNFHVNLVFLVVTCTLFLLMGLFAWIRQTSASKSTELAADPSFKRVQPSVIQPTGHI